VAAREHSADAYCPQASSTVGGGMSMPPSFPPAPPLPSFCAATLPQAARPTPPTAITNNEARFDRMHIPRGSMDTEAVSARQVFTQALST